jgi:hypothetical protein
MKPFLRARQNIRGQAMVEFMVVLPLLLLLLYGTMEVARLAFIFSSASNASRSAARYGAGAGENVEGVPFYQDCEGIRDIVRQSAFINEFSEINITYDRGVDANGVQIPIGGVDPNPGQNSCPIEDGRVRNGDRIIIQVSTSYEPIVSVIPIDPLDIVSSSARTFIVSIPIMGSSVPLSFSAETSTPSPIPTQDRNTNTAVFTTVPTFTRLPANVTPIERTPTSNLPPTLTFTPSRTPLPTFTATITPTFISCSGVTGVGHGPLRIHENIMEMAIFNNTGHVLSTGQIYVEWNHDTGHASTEDRSLHLGLISLDNQQWQDDIFAPSKYVEGFYPFIPQGESVIRFIFHQTYNISDGTERIIITLGTPGCTNYPIDSRN